MRFIVAKPENRMSPGNLFYSIPLYEESAKAYDKLESMCLSKYEEILSDKLSVIDQTIISAQIQKELEIVKATDSAVAFLMMAEIAKLSEEQGYPAILLGNESGLIISYLLGISNVQPCQLGYSTIPSDIVYDEVLYKDELTFTLAIAEPVRKFVQGRMDRCFCYIEDNKYCFKKIDLPDNSMLKTIGDRSKETGINYTDINLEDEKLIEAVNNDICRSDFNCEPYYPVPKNTLELARVFAYACCTTESKDNFTAIKDYIFCGDIYEALKKTEISAGKIIQLIRNWCTGEKKENVLKMFEEYGADEKMIDVYRELYNQWHATSSLARVNALIMLKYFENI